MLCVPSLAQGVYATRVQRGVAGAAAQSRHDRIYDAWYTSYTIGVRTLLSGVIFFRRGSPTEELPGRRYRWDIICGFLSYACVHVEAIG